MSTFENTEFRYRETYFVMFRSGARPSLEAIEQTVCKLSDRFEITKPSLGEDGSFESLTVVSPDDYAAVDISYVSGDEVVTHVNELVEELSHGDVDADVRKKLDRIVTCDARFEITHFEQVLGDSDGDDMLDPGALLIVLGALAELTDGVGVDPQSGTLL